MSKKQNKDSSIKNYVGEKIMADLSKLFDNVKKGDEFEFMFFTKKGRYLPQDKYIQLLKFFSNRAKSNPKYKLAPVQDTLDVIYSENNGTNIRCTISGTEKINSLMKKLIMLKNHVIFSALVGLKDKNVDVMKKEKKAEELVDIDDLDMRARLSKESKLSSEESKMFSSLDETYMDKIKYRYKQRSSLYIFGSEDDEHFIRVDLTYTRMADSFKKINHVVPNYELEIEYGTNSSSKAEYLDLMLQEAELLLKIIQQSNHLITRSTAIKVLEYYKNLLSIPPSENIIALDARQSITLEIQHVTEVLPNKYAVTDKADGERHFMIIFDNYVYFISTNLYVRNTGIILPSKLSEYNGSILDGELIFIGHKNRHLFLVFDCLFHKSQDVRGKIKLMERISYADDIIKACFVSETQKGYDFDKKKTISGKFDLDERMAMHFDAVKQSIANINHDIEIDKKYPLIRRKFFAEALGAKDWEIFAYALTIWNAFTNNSEIKCPYLLDGLIFQPLEQSYVTSAKDSKSSDFKWKPPEKNSVDFYVEFEKDANGKAITVYDNSFDEYIRNKTYKICRLHVGQKNKNVEVPILFKEEQDLYNAYIFLNDGEVRDLDGNILSDKTVIEFYYNNDPNILDKFRWVPIRTRYDKTESVIRFGKKYGNYVTVADKVWRSIINPILMSDFDDLAKGNDPDKNLYFYNKKVDALRKKIGHELIISATKESAYFQQRTNLAKPMRNFSNWIKSNQMYTFCHSMYQNNKQLSIFDVACGRGSDIMRFYYTLASFVVGIDVDREGLVSAVDGAISRYNRFKTKKANFPQMYFIQADATADLNIESQKSALGVSRLENEQYFMKFFSNDPKKKTVFDIINCQFAIHYMLRNEDSWKNFKKNINSHLRNGGYMLITTFDGTRITELLKGIDNYMQEYTNEAGKVKTLFEIVKKYQDPKDSNVIMGVGNAIDVYMSWISLEGKYLTEYLVDSRFLVSEFKKDCNMDLVDSDSFGNQMAIHEPYLTHYAKFEPNEQTRAFLSDAAEFYKKNSVNDGCKKFNDLMRYYVFRKNGPTTGQTGGNNEVPDFSDTTKFVIPKMMDYDTNYSCVNSVHHIMKNHKIIPKYVTPESFCQDIGVNYAEDVNIKSLGKLAKSAVIEHEIIREGKKKMEKVLDGVNIFVVERDCNDYYDIDLIKKSEKTKKNDKSIILMREGTWYVPVYYLDDETQQRIGLFDNSHPLIKQMIENI